MGRTKLAFLRGSAAVGLAALLPAAALAEESAPDEIVVTAQRRAEPVQQVPIQISVLTGQQVEDAGIRRTEDVLAQLPNMTFDRGNNYRSSFITMRGLTQITTADPPIAFVVDGVPQAHQETIGVNLFDIERIEVLRGPQGALYGRNALGGAINVITREPGNVIEGRVDASYAEGDRFDASAALSGPVVRDRLMFRVAATYRSAGGQIENRFRGDKIDDVDHDYSLRGRLLFRPESRLSVDLRVEHGDFRGNSNENSVVFSGDPNDFVAPQSNLPGVAEGDSTDLTAKIDYDLGFATLTSITGRTRFSQAVRADFDFRNPVASPGGFFGTGQIGQGQDLTIRTLSQEVRLVSASDQRLRWLLGGYYLGTDRSLRLRAFTDLNGELSQINNPALVFIELWDSNDNDAYAAFGQVDFDLTPALTLTGGLRYDEDRRRQTIVTTGDRRRATFDHLQPKVTLSWKQGSDGLVYATYSTGFRSGGFNLPNPTVPVFDEEKLKNYEVGFKRRLSDWFDLNGAVFRSYVNNYQYFHLDVAAGTQLIDNIDRVRIQGLELEAQVRPLEGLEASVGIGVTDTEIRRSAVASEVGNHTPRTSPFSATSALQYRRPMRDGLDGFARVEWQHHGRKYWHADNADVQKSYDIVNLRVGIERGSLGLYAFVRNLLDEKYYTDFYQPHHHGADIAIGFLGAPRSFGLAAKLSFQP